MGISKYPEFNEPILVSMCVDTVADATNIITIGNVDVAAISYANGGAIDALSADAFTDVVDINLGSPFVFQFANVSSADHQAEIVMGAETAGDYVRMQYELDGNAILDITVGPSKTQTVLSSTITTSELGIPYYAKTRLRIRLFKHGTIAEAGSTIKIGGILYRGVSL
jgi:hypothetical protein